MKFLTLGWSGVFFGIMLMNYYIYKSYWRLPFKSYRLPKLFIYLFIQLILFLATLYYFYKFFDGDIDSNSVRKLSYLAAFYISILHYSSIFYLLHDLGYLTRKFIDYPIKFQMFIGRIFFAGIIIYLTAGLISFLGILNARDYQVKSYKLNLDKKDSSLDKLSIVYISDGHLGVSLRVEDLDKLLEKIEKLNPDILFLGGDFFDEATSLEDKKKFSKKISSLDLPYGVVAVEGNHEYKSGNCIIEEEMGYLKNESIRVLQDQVYKEDGKFYIIGRKDRAGNYKPLASIAKEAKEEIIDKNLPFIVLDHRPGFNEALDLGYDLQLSGHTHSGQFFPVQILNKPINKLFKSQVYGFLSKGNFNIIVSSGLGNWGIPTRIGSRRELVHIDIEFK